MNKLAMPMGLSRSGGAKTAVSAQLCLVLEPLSAIDISVGMAKPSQCQGHMHGASSSKICKVSRLPTP